MLHSDLKHAGLKAFGLAVFFTCALLCAAPHADAGADGNNASAAVMEGDVAGAPLEKFKVDGNDRVLKADADWVIEDVENGNVFDIEYTADGKHLVLYGREKMTLVDALNGEIIGVFNHAFNQDEMQYGHIMITPGNVGVNSDGSLAAVGIKSGRPGQTGRSGIALVSTDGSAESDTILFNGNYGNVVASRFLPDKRHLAVCLFENTGAELDIRSGGGYGIYDYVDNKWLWFTQGVAARLVEVSPSGKFVAFDVYSYNYNFSGTFTTESYSSWGRLVDVKKAAEAPTLMERFRLKQSPNDKARLYFRVSADGSPAEVFYERAGEFTAALVRDYVATGEFIDADRYVYLKRNRDLNLSELYVLDPDTGEGLTTDCSWSVAVGGFAVSPDGKKIALIGGVSMLWQEDFDCIDD